jgi:hypothetical protein
MDLSRRDFLRASTSAAAGTAIVLGTRDSYAVLPAGSIVRIRLDKSLNVPA